MFFRFPPDARWNPDQNAVEFGIGVGEYEGVVRGFPARVPNTACRGSHTRTLPRSLPSSPDPSRTCRRAETSATAVGRRRQCRDHGSRSAGTGTPGALRSSHRLSPGRFVRAAKLSLPRQPAAFDGKQAARDAERWFPVRIRIAVPRLPSPSGETRRTRSGCCACPASGHSAAPARTAMNPRRPTEKRWLFTT